jgi:hypothetical protein
MHHPQKTTTLADRKTVQCGVEVTELSTNKQRSLSVCSQILSHKHQSSLFEKQYNIILYYIMCACEKDLGYAQV